MGFSLPRTASAFVRSSRNICRAWPEDTPLEPQRLSIAFVSLRACALTQPPCGLLVGGAELQAALHAKRLAQQGDMDVCLYVADLGQGERRDGALVVRPLIRLDPDLRLRARRLPAIVWRLARAGHHLYVTRSASGINGLTLAAARLCGAKHLHMCAGDDESAGRPDPLMSSRGAWLHHRAMRRADALSCQSAAQQQAIRLAYKRDAVILPNLMPSPPDVPPDLPRLGFLWVGRDVEVKRPELFLELARRLPDVPFTMVCQPHADRDLQRLVRSAPPNVKLLPGLPFDETARLFAAHRGIVCTSRIEGFPNTFLQAAQAGTPIMSLGIDPDGIVQAHKAGFVAEDVESLAKRCAELAADAALWSTCSRGARELARALCAREQTVVDLIRALARPVFEERQV